MIPYGFELALNTFTKTSTGELTRDRFLRFEGYGFYVCVMRAEFGFKQVSVRPGNRADYEERYGDEPFEVVIEYDDVTPKEAVLHVGAHKLQGDKVSEFASKLNRAGYAVQAINMLLERLDGILEETRKDVVS